MRHTYISLCYGGRDGYYQGSSGSTQLSGSASLSRAREFLWRDANIVNSIFAQYTIRTRIPELPISKVSRDLSFEERLLIVDSVDIIISQIDSVGFNTVGRLIAQTSYSESSRKSSVIENSVELKPFPLGLIESSTEVPADTTISLKDLVFSMIDAWP